MYFMHSFIRIAYVFVYLLCGCMGETSSVFISSQKLLYNNFIIIIIVVVVIIILLSYNFSMYTVYIHLCFSLHG